MAINVRINNGITQKVSSSTVFLGATNVQDEVNTANNNATLALSVASNILAYANGAFTEANNIISGTQPLTIVDAGTF
jgi:hypothetical protein